ncbi:MAG: nitroreductase family protein [Acidimicrobiales bacterium]
MEPASVSGPGEASAPVDHVLRTTRAVRRRLDLDRAVDDQTIFDCIDIAEQAPTGGNQSSRRWLVVRDPERKRALAEIYRRCGGDWAISQRDALAGPGIPTRR